MRSYRKSNHELVPGDQVCKKDSAVIQSHQTWQRLENNTESLQYLHISTSQINKHRKSSHSEIYITMGWGTVLGFAANAAPFSGIFGTPLSKSHAGISLMWIRMWYRYSWSIWLPTSGMLVSVLLTSLSSICLRRAWLAGMACKSCIETSMPISVLNTFKPNNTNALPQQRSKMYIHTTRDDGKRHHTSEFALLLSSRLMLLLWNQLAFRLRFKNSLFWDVIFSVTKNTLY